MLSIEPVDRLSRISTSCPLSSSASERWDPMNPAPPVINARTRLSFPSGDHGPRLEGMHRRGNLVDFIVAQGGMKG